MKIRYIKTGTIDHVENAQGRAFIEAGLAEPILDRTLKPTPVITPKYSTSIMTGTTRRYLVLICEVLNRKDYFSGDPATITDRDFGRPVASIPKEVLAEYARQWKANPELRDEYATHTQIPGSRGKVSKSSEGLGF
jgi:hypothetical protein